MGPVRRSDKAVLLRCAAHNAIIACNAVSASERKNAAQAQATAAGPDGAPGDGALLGSVGSGNTRTVGAGQRLETAPNGPGTFRGGRWREAATALDLRASDILSGRRAPKVCSRSCTRRRRTAAVAAGRLIWRRRSRSGAEAERAVKLLTALAMGDNAYTFLDFLYDACRAYWQLERVEAADALFKPGGRNLASSPGQPDAGCSALARLPVANEDRGTQPTPTSLAYSETRARDTQRVAVRTRPLCERVPEVHGAEFRAMLGKPWRELVLYDGEKAGWGGKSRSVPGVRCATAPSLITGRRRRQPSLPLSGERAGLAPGARVRRPRRPTSVA